MSDETPETGECFECGIECFKDDDFCHGCGEVICGNCSVNMTVTPGHQPEEHLDPTEEEDDE